jgi:hypothetical protein
MAPMNPMAIAVRSRRLLLTITAFMVLSIAALGGAAKSAHAAGPYDYLLPAYGACGTAGEGDMSKSYAEWSASARCFVNAARANAGVAQYPTLPYLTDSSYHKASDISVCMPNAYDADAVHHACGQPVNKWIVFPRACASWGYAENVYIGSGAASTARAAVSWWLNSDAHRAALLSPQYTGQGLEYSGPTIYPGIGSNTRIWVEHMTYCN